MSTEVRNIGIGFGRRDNWHDGLGEFSRQLGGFFAKNADQLRSDFRISLYFHMPDRLHGYFGENVSYLSSRSYHRYFHLTAERFDLWHTLHQHISHKPPIGTVERLLTVHDLNFLYFKATSKIDKYMRRTRRLIEKQTSLVAISEHVRNDLVHHIKPVLEPEVIYNGSTDLTQAERQAPPSVRSTGFLLHISRMATSKNVTCLLDLALEMPHQMFVFAGPRSRDTQLVAEAIKIRGIGNVQLLESVSEAEKSWLYANCGGFIFPSITEGFGLPPLEAMHFGKPVFLSRLTSLPEVGGSQAFYFDSFDAKAMRRVVISGLAAAGNPEYATATAEHARGFSWPRCGQAYLATYVRLLERRAKSR